MNSVTAYWQRVAAMRPDIKGRTAFITSVDVPERGVTPDSVSEVLAEGAARRLAERTHRLSTPEEIQRFHTEQAARDMQCRLLTEKQKERSVLALTPELAAQLGMIAPQPGNAIPNPEIPPKGARHRTEQVPA
jgi:hypothetical protein